MNKKNVLITGADGLIGRALVCELLDQFELRTHIRNGPKSCRVFQDQKLEGKLSIVAQDLTRMSTRECQQLVKGCFAVIHCAGLVHQPNASYEEYQINNVKVTEQLIDGCIAAQVPNFVFFSTSAVYGVGPFELIDEDALLNPKTPYAVSKLKCEELLNARKGFTKIIILRPSLVFGEGDRGNLLGLIREVKSRRYRHIGDGSARKSIIYSKDVAYAISLCLNRLPDGQHVLNVANPESVTVKSLAESVAYALDSSIKIQSVPIGLARMGLKAAHSLMPGMIKITEEQLDKLVTSTTCSIGRLVNAVDFSPKYSLQRALKAEIEWAQNEGLL